METAPDHHLTGDELLDLVERGEADEDDMALGAEAHLEACPSCLLTYTRLAAIASGVADTTGGEDAGPRSWAALVPRLAPFSPAVRRATGGPQAGSCLDLRPTRTIALLFEEEVEVSMVETADGTLVMVAAADIDQLSAVEAPGLVETGRDAMCWVGQLPPLEGEPLLLLITYGGERAAVLMEARAEQPDLPLES